MIESTTFWFNYLKRRIIIHSLQAMMINMVTMTLER